MRELWVSAYEVTQKYAGPEEGGWFYDVGIPLWTSPLYCYCQTEYNEHTDYCPVQALLKQAHAFIEGLENGYLESFTSKDAEEPEHRGESIHRKHEVRVENTIPQAYGLEPPRYE